MKNKEPLANYEIGSNFYLDKKNVLCQNEIRLNHLEIEFKDEVYLSTGRSAISFVLSHLEGKIARKVALLPYFTCHTVIQPFLKAAYKIYFYEVNKNLDVDASCIRTMVEDHSPTVIFFHSYFGFDTLAGTKGLSDLFERKNVIIINDLTQSLYSNIHNLKADYCIASLRKWGPLTDGGFALSSTDTFNDKPTETDVELEYKKLEAMHSKNLYINYGIGDKEGYLKRFKEAEEILTNQNGFYAMSKSAKYVQSNLDLDALSKRRRDNYNVLLDTIIGLDYLKPIFPELPPSVTPLYFPIYTEKRDELQRYLAKENIFCPVIWPKPIFLKDFFIESNDWIYTHILAIPCDQRYGEKDMLFISDALNTFNA